MFVDSLWQSQGVAGVLLLSVCVFVGQKDTHTRLPSDYPCATWKSRCTHTHKLRCVCAHVSVIPLCWSVKELICDTTSHTDVVFRFLCSIETNEFLN